MGQDAERGLLPVQNGRDTPGKQERDSTTYSFNKEISDILVSPNHYNNLLPQKEPKKDFVVSFSTYHLRSHCRLANIFH